MRIIWLAGVFLLWSITSAAANAQSAAAPAPVPHELVPPTTVFYAIGAGSDTLLQLPLVKELTGTPLFDKLWKSPDAMKLRGGITLAEVALGDRLPVVLGKLTADGWGLAVDGQTKGVVLWAHTRDATVRQELFQKLLSIAQADAKSKKKEIKQTTYREVEAFEVNGAIVVGMANYLVISNNGDLLKGMIDRWREPTAQRGQANEHFRELTPPDSESNSPNALPRQPLARAWLDVRQLRESGLVKNLFNETRDNFAVELLIGGIVSAMQQASTIEFRLESQGNQLALQMLTPRAKNLEAERYEYFFGPAISGQAPPMIDLGGTQANLSMYRDIGQLWLRAGDIFGQKTNDQLAQAETTLSTLFSGRDFASEILGAIRPEIQLVVTEQQFGTGDAPIPQVKLPAFALVMRLRDPQTMQPQLKRIFMSLIGFLNVTSAMNQQPQLDLDGFRLEQGWEVAATYAIEADRPKDWVVPVQYNFSPTLLMIQDYAIVSSTQSLAQSISQKLQEPAGTTKVAGAGHANSMLSVSGQLLNDLMKANRQQLISQNMVEKGHSQEEAAAEVDVLLQALQMMKALRVAFLVGDGTRLDVQLELASQQP